MNRLQATGCYKRGHKVIVALIVTFCLGCNDPVAPSLAPGVYPVFSVDGRALPTTLPVMGRGNCVVRTLYRSAFSFGADSIFEQRFWFTTDPTEQPAIYRSSYIQRGTKIEISEGAGSGSFRRGTLRIEMPVTQICDALTWEAELR